MDITTNREGDGKSAKLGFFPNLALWLGIILALLLILLISSVPLTFEQQLLFALASLGLSLLIRPENDRLRYRLIVLIIISVMATGRYMYWRVSESMGWFDPSLDLTFWDYLFSIGLLMAEFYAWTVLFLGYFQTIWPLRRRVLDLPQDTSKWPTVDVYIPTYDEPLKVVAPSILAARNLDWPQHKLRVFVLDDGCREDFMKFSAEAGVNYIERKEREGEKAGNINHAMEMTHGEYIAIFDSDHVPVRCFLKKTMGWLLKDHNLGLVQTPHLFFTPDPVERNLQIYHRVPNEGQLFYGLVQDGNDAWNSAFFCGSCAVLRRKALEEIGGVATDTVTEDAHTSILMQKQGWNSAYINIPLAAGLATERLSGHIGQRIRWALGMTQILRKVNPLLIRGLTVAQRLAYFNAMLHFLFSLPRIIFLTAPLAYLFFESYVIQANAAIIAVFALPHIFQAHVANSAMQGRFRHSFWAEVYETILAPHILFPTLGALIAPNKGKFNVTSKGGMTKEDHFDWSSSKFIFLLLVLNIAGLVIGVFRLFWWNLDETGAVIINLGWTLYNAIIVGAALAVSWERRQRRANARIHRQYTAFLHTSDGRVFMAITRDISTGDLSLKTLKRIKVRPGDYVTIEIFDGDKPYHFKGVAATVEGRHLGIKFETMSARNMADLIYFSHGHDNAWEQWYVACKPSKPLSSLLEIVRFGIIGAFRALSSHTDDPENRVRPGYAVSGWLLVILIIALTSFLSPKSVQAKELQGVPVDKVAAELVVLPFHELGVKNPISLRGGSTQHDVWFALRSDEITRSAVLVLIYTLAEELLADYQTLRVSINGQELGNIPLEKYATGQTLKQTFPIDPLYVSDLNQVSMKLIPQKSNFCEKLVPKLKEALISVESEIRMSIGPLNLINELALFPVPFFDRLDDEKLGLPFIFDHELATSPDALKAAAIVASYFGAKADYRGSNFPVFIDSVPERHSIVLATPQSNYEFLPDLAINGPSVALIPRPGMEHVKMLVVMGLNEAQLIQAASALVSSSTELNSDRVEFANVSIPSQREPYDVRRWLPKGQKHLFRDLLDEGKLTVKGLKPDTINLTFRVAPDLFLWRNNKVPMKFTYHYTDLPLRWDSVFSVDLNQDGLRSYQLGTNNQLLETIQPLPENLPDADEYEPSYASQNEKLVMPLTKLSGQNQLTFFFDYQIPEKYGTQCINLYAEHMQGSIDPNSYIDLRGFSHFARLPDLAMFANMGFPFTRRADLADTAIVIPFHPRENDIQTLLELVGRMGTATGNSAYHVSVMYPDTAMAAGDKDILLIGSPSRQSLLIVWKDKLPIVPAEDNGWKLRTFSIKEKFDLWLQGERESHLNEFNFLLDSQRNDFAGLMSFRSPLNKDRTVVAMIAKDSRQMLGVTESLNHPNQVAEFHGDFVAVSGEGVKHFRLLPTYHVGQLPWLTAIRWYLSTHIFLLIFLAIIMALIAAWVLKVKLKQHAASRFEDLEITRA